MKHITHTLSKDSQPRLEKANKQTLTQTIPERMVSVIAKQYAHDKETPAKRTTRRTKNRTLTTERQE